MNAVLLAAGMGTRLRPLTASLPKALVKVGTESFFERQLRLLGAAGVSDITVVTGYCAEAFGPWIDRPGLRFLRNDRYREWNNLYSMYLALDRLGDTIVLDGDVWIGEGVLPAGSPATSRWLVGYKAGMRDEWAVRCGKDDRVERVDVASGSDWILTGISYWSAADGALLRGRVETLIRSDGAPGLFWDEAPRSLLAEMDVRAQRIGQDDWAEIDTLEDLEALKGRLCRFSRSVF
jgi:CTP:phosphocholine cytidylyltransferase-like protein